MSGTVLKQHVDSMHRVKGPAAGMVEACMRRKASGLGAMKIQMDKKLRMPVKVQAMIDGMVRDAAVQLHCSVQDIIWTLGIYGGKPVLHCKRRPRLELTG